MRKNWENFTNSKSFKIFILSIYSVAVFFLQTYIAPNSGKEKINQSNDFRFQLDTHYQSVLTTFNTINRENLYQKLSLRSGEKSINEEYFDDVFRYQTYLNEILNSLKNMGHTTMSIIDEIIWFENNGILFYSSEEESNIFSDTENFSKLSNGLFEKIEAIKSFNSNLNESFTIDYRTLPPKEGAEIISKQLNTISTLYQNENLFLHPNAQNFKFLDDYGVSISKLLRHYSISVEKYNKRVSMQQAFKNIAILILSIYAAYLTFLKEKKDYERAN